MNRVRLELDHAAIARLGRDASLMGPELTLAARRVAVAAKGVTPPGADRTRAFDRMMRQSPARVEGGTVVVWVGSGWSLAHLFEFGSINSHPYRPITRAARAQGLRVEVH